MKAMNLALFAVIAMSLSLQACKASKATRDANDLEKLLESDGSGNWQYVKADESRIKNYAVFLGPDGKYHAFKTNVPTSGVTKAEYLAANTSYDDIRKDFRTDTYWGAPKGSNNCPIAADVDFTCSSLERDERGRAIKSFRYDAWLDRTTEEEIVYVDRTTGITFELGDGTSKDLEAVSASIESLANDSIRDQLVAGYGLSESRASEIASLARSWQNLEKSRAMTSSDLTQFQTKVFGSDLNAVKKAAVKAANGNSKEYDQLVKKAAKLNDVSPEQAKEIFSNFID